MLIDEVKRGEPLAMIVRDVYAGELEMRHDGADHSEPADGLARPDAGAKIV